MNTIILKLEKHISNAIEHETRLGLLDGLSGYLLFYNTLCKTYSNEDYKNKLVKVIEKINLILEQQHVSFSLCSGLAGYGLALLQIKNNFIEIDEEYLDSIDYILFDKLDAESEKNNYDFMHGSMGIAMYFVERWKKNKSILISNKLNLFAEVLILNIEKNKKDFFIKENGFVSEKHIHFGIAHGVSGYINFLTYLQTNFIDLQSNITNSIEICIDVLKSYEKYNEISNQFYPHSTLLESDTINPAIFGWCQGDLGVSNAFYNASVFLRDENLKKESTKLISNSKNITITNSRINDFGICHGSTGIIAQYKLNSIKQDIDCKQEINKWFDIVQKQTDNFEVFMAHQGHNEYISETNLLSGSIGLAMTLLTIENKIDLSWLKCLNLY